jgi:hypothetical protein
MALAWWLYRTHDANANANIGRSPNVRWNSGVLQVDPIPLTECSLNVH